MDLWYRLDQLPCAMLHIIVQESPMASPTEAVLRSSRTSSLGPRRKKCISLLFGWFSKTHPELVALEAKPLTAVAVQIDASTCLSERGSDDRLQPWFMHPG